jgi:hypothetical protein
MDTAHTPEWIEAQNTRKPIATLGSLPEEILEEIASYLKINDFIALVSTHCRMATALTHNPAIVARV